MNTLNGGEAMSGLISEVIPGSIAEEVGIAAGDELLSINGFLIRDLIDYNYYCDDSYLEIEIKKPDGEIWVYELEKYPDEELGLVFTANVFDGIRSCRNHCMFCFIDQLHPQPRRSLLLKDDDYRMSFLEGSFITCTNMKEEDYRRISEMHLSPVYVSVHAVDPLVRQRLLGRKQPAEIMLTLQRLISMGVTLHTQIVLCPGINDGAVLEQTLDSLYELHPGVETVAIVPVGLTKYQKNPLLRAFSAEEARLLIQDVEARQQEYIQRLGSAFVYVADELYIKAGLPFPHAEIYGDFAQIENGVGMAALFMQQWEFCKQQLPDNPPMAKTAVVTGCSGACIMRPVIDEINARYNSDIQLLEISNSFYGESITVTGLLTAGCILQAVSPGSYERLILPSTMLKHDQDIFLDDITVDQLAQKLQMQVVIGDTNPMGLVAALFDK